MDSDTVAAAIVYIEGNNAGEVVHLAAEYAQAGDRIGIAEDAAHAVNIPVARPGKADTARHQGE